MNLMAAGDGNPDSRCPECGRIVGSESQQRHGISVRATILSLGRFGIASPEVTKRTEKEWARYRAENRLDLYGRRISKVRVSGLDRARDAIDLIASIIDAPGLVEHTIFGEDLFDCRAPPSGVVFTEDVAKIAGQQGRYTVEHQLSPFGDYRDAPNKLNFEGSSRVRPCNSNSCG